MTTPTNHLHCDIGCQTCKPKGYSKGELKISNYLKDKGLYFQKEKTFKNCGNGRLRYDFYVPEKNLLIEYDGAQHFTPIDYFGGMDQYKRMKYYDNVKDNYAMDNGFQFKRIPYTKYDNIENILNEVI